MKIDKKILIVDDEPGICSLIKALLAPFYEVLTASDGQQAYYMALGAKPSLILSDLLMPEMDGFQLLTKLKNHEETRAIPTVILSALGDTDSILRAQRLGISDYLIKPFDLEELPRLVKKYV